ncbi:MAG TPA: hypothetical protein PKH39_10240, partial [Woeseiaceae bacterium]|nr:hypothetical protein [Woeseiaceae bacterium]
MKMALAGILACFCIAFASSPVNGNPTQSSNPISSWNEVVLAIAEDEDGFLTLKGLRTATMMHIAIHDAIAAIDGSYAPYIYGEHIDDADPIVAATQAAFTVATDQYPAHYDQLASLKDQWLSATAEGHEKEAGILVGKESAAAILKNRVGDGWDTAAE